MHLRFDITLGLDGHTMGQPMSSITTFEPASLQVPLVAQWLPLTET